MSRTLFWYVGRDLLRIFLMTSVVLAGIMSFGGLLKPLTQYGLSGAQVVKILAYFMPAMMTYSLPIAALFATTIVYGRLAADNELTACRASGISYLSMALPAFVLGLFLALASIFALSFLVPKYALKVENVAFASLADAVQKSITRSHQLKPPGVPYTIFAESAEVLPPPADEPDAELVVLYEPMFCFYELDEKTNTTVPREIYTAREAAVRIRQGDEQLEFSAELIDGVKIPRDFAGASTGGIRVATFGPVPLPSPVRENTKFMDYRQLRKLAEDPLKSKEIRGLFAQLTRQQQEHAFLESVLAALNNGLSCALVDTDGRTLTLEVDPGAIVLWRKGRIHVDSATQSLRQARIVTAAGTDAAAHVIIDAQARPDLKTVIVQLDLLNVLPAAGSGRDSLTRTLRIPMPAPLLEIQKRTPADYALATAKTPEAIRLRKKLASLRSDIHAESHGRASFAVSCLILVLVGCALGMMFKTGNYLSAFSLSVIPALMCIALVATGQHVAEADPRNLSFGLAIIWSGNLAVLILAAILLGRLHRQ